MTLTGRTSLHPDYDKAFIEAFNALKMYKLSTVPVDLNKILSALRNVNICSYTKFCNNRSITLDEAIEHLGSDLGAITKHPKKDRYIIYYNDTKNKEGLDRFTIAHELGHYFLKHLFIDGRILRKGFSDEDYNDLEKEVNSFARNLLSPLPLADLVLKDYEIHNGNIYRLINIFNISYEAAQWRIWFSTWDRYKVREDHIKFFNDFTFDCGRYCNICSSISVDTNFCEICGNSLKTNSTLFDYDTYFLTKDDIVIFEETYIKRCVVCDNEEIEFQHDYCFICGSDLKNNCSNIDCEVHILGDSLKKSARYCHKCGHKSSFFQVGLLQNWDYIEPPDLFDIDEYVNEDDLPF